MSGIASSLYGAASRMAGPFLKSWLKARARKGKEVPDRLGERFGRTETPRPQGKLVWFHAASVGESLSALPLLRAVLDANPQAHVLFTTGTVTSAALLAERLPARAIHQFVPLDTPSAVRAFMAHWKPDLALWVESDLWPNLLAAVKKAGIPAALVNARLSEKSFVGWKRAPAFAREVLSVFSIALAQTEETLVRLSVLGVSNIIVTGNLKAASAPLPAAPDALAQLREMIGARPVFAAASTHDDEEAQLGRVYTKLRDRFPDLLMILAPRHPDRGAAIAETLRGQGLAVSRRGAKVRIVPETHVYLMDTIGELGLLYRTAPFAFIGGSLVPHGGQNPLEPARLGVAPLHGPHVFNFRADYADLDGAGASFAINDAGDLAAHAERLLGAPDLAQTAGAKAKAIAEAGAGALDAAKSALAPLIRKAGLDEPA